MKLIHSINAATNDARIKVQIYDRGFNAETRYQSAVQVFDSGEEIEAEGYESDDLETLTESMRNLAGDLANIVEDVEKGWGLTRPIMRAPTFHSLNA